MPQVHSSKYLVIGAGLTAANASDKIRELDATGKITLLGLEPHLPYDRPPLTKDFLQDDSMKLEDILSRPAAFYDNKQITVKSGTRATSIDRFKNTVACENGDRYQYDYLLLATGASPRLLDVPGKHLDGVKILRWVDESTAIRDALHHAKRVVLVGAGYIGLEVTASVLKRAKGAHITVIDPSEHPWARFASPMLGSFLQQYFSEMGVNFIMGDSVAEFVGDDRLTGVKLKSGRQIPTDLAVVGIGVSLETGIAKDAGLDVDEREGVVVDEYLRTTDPNIWAAGDIAYFPDVAMGQRWHLEHYMNAMWQGEAVGTNMAGKSSHYDRVPYFFSDMGDLHMVLRGNVRDAGDTRVIGNPSTHRFVELYPNKEGIVRMIVAVSGNQAELETLADRYEGIIRQHRGIAELGEGDLGI